MHQASATGLLDSLYPRTTQSVSECCRKVFLESYFNLCACVLDRKLQVLLSTNPTGENQPGFTEVGWTVPKTDARELF